MRRPALAKVLEQDESAAKYMILCVAALLPHSTAVSTHAEVDAMHGGDSERGDGVGKASREADDDDPDTVLLLHRKQYGVCQLELTDGWYSVAAKLDPPLLLLLQQGRVRVGDKLRVMNASLAGASDACTPLENEDVYVELHANSTRRASNDRKLGVQSTATFSVCLASVREGGGAIPCMHAAVGRVYPIMCMEVMEDGTKVHRNQRAEDAQQERWERRMDREMDQKRAEWEMKMEQHTACSQPPHMSTRPTHSQHSQLQCSDPMTSVSSAAALELDAPEPRRRVPYLKVRLYELVPPTASIARSDGERAAWDDSSALLPAVLTGAECTFTVWRPTEDDMHALTEGSAVCIYSAQVAGRHDGLLRLSSSRSTPIVPNVHLAPLTSLFRRLCSFSQLHALQRSDEFDIAVCLVYEQRYSSQAPFSSEQQHTRQLYCCYDSDELLMIDIKEDDTQLHFAVDQPLRTPLTLLACNLRYTGYDRAHRVHTAQSSASAVFATRAAASSDKQQEADKVSAPRRHVIDGWRQCRQWFSSDGGKAVTSLQRQRAIALVEGVQNDSAHFSDSLLCAIAAAQAELSG